MESRTQLDPVVRKAPRHQSGSRSGRAPAEKTPRKTLRSRAIGISEQAHIAPRKRHQCTRMATVLLARIVQQTENLRIKQDILWILFDGSG